MSSFLNKYFFDYEGQTGCKKQNAGGWCLDQLKPKSRRYQPIYLNPPMASGSESIRDHLLLEHRIKKTTIKEMTVDECFRKHDELHGRRRKRA